MNHKFYHKGERNVGTVAQVSTISAYPSLSEGDLDNNWNTCGHDRRSWHYLGLPFTIKMLTLSRRTLHYPKVIWTKNGINVGTIVEVGTISAYLSL